LTMLAPVLLVLGGPITHGADHPPPEDTCQVFKRILDKIAPAGPL
jgi:cytochrome c oxidase assembly factor CtaG